MPSSFACYMLRYEWITQASAAVDKNRLTSGAKSLQLAMVGARGHPIRVRRAIALNLYPLLSVPSIRMADPPVFGSRRDQNQTVRKEQGP
jgi:hypothetical protein